MNFWKTVYRTAWAIFAGLALAAAAIVFIPKWREYQEYHRRRAEAQELMRMENDRLNLLKQKQERFETDPRFVERMAHEQGLARPGEVIFRFHGDESAPRR